MNVCPCVKNGSPNAFAPFSGGTSFFRAVSANSPETVRDVIALGVDVRRDPVPREQRSGRHGVSFVEARGREPDGARGRRRATDAVAGVEQHSPDPDVTAPPKRRHADTTIATTIGSAPSTITSGASAPNRVTTKRYPQIATYAASATAAIHHQRARVLRTSVVTEARSPECPLLAVRPRGACDAAARTARRARAPRLVRARFGR